MEPHHRKAGDLRAQTDASLGSERTTTDDAADRAALRSQRTLDDLIERDRISADARLLEYREDADDMLADGRAAAPAPDAAVATEREAADDDKKAERRITDSILDGQRRRVDASLETERRERQQDQQRLRAYRRDTDNRLSTERDEADEAALILDKTRNALTYATSEQQHRADIFAMVTHDLRNPLTIIAGNAGWIVSTDPEAATKEAAELIVLAAARMERLLRDLLDVARVEAGTLRIVKRAHDVGRLVTEVFRSYQPVFAGRRMTLIAETPSAPISAPFDYDRIVQVLSNVLGNAMKFMGPGGTAVLSAVRRGGDVELTLSDNGPGIHPDQLPHLFERFWQADGGVRRGLGLGLYICEQVVVAHGGRIWVESELGSGTTFRFTLPVT
jgi:signal transduction histidine kinase